MDWPHTQMWQLRIQEGYLNCRGPPKEQGVLSQPHARLPSPEHQCWEEEPTKHMAVKTNRDSAYLDEAKGCWQPRYTLKWMTHRLPLAGTHLGSGGGTVSQKAPETYKEKLVMWLQGKNLRASCQYLCVEPYFNVVSRWLLSFICSALLQHNQIWTWIHLVNFICSILTISWDPTPSNSSTKQGSSGGRQSAVACAIYSLT